MSPHGIAVDLEDGQNTCFELQFLEKFTRVLSPEGMHMFVRVHEGETVQLLRKCDSLAEDPASVPRTHTEAHSSLTLVLGEPLMLSSGLCSHCMGVVCKYTSRYNTHTFK